MLWVIVTGVSAASVSASLPWEGGKHLSHWSQVVLYSLPTAPRKAAAACPRTPEVWVLQPLFWPGLAPQCLPLAKGKPVLEQASPDEDRGQILTSFPKSQGLTKPWSQSSCPALEASKEGPFRPLASTQGERGSPLPPGLLLRGSPRPASSHKDSRDIFFCHFTDATCLCIPAQTSRSLSSGLSAWATCWHQGWTVGKGEGGGLRPAGSYGTEGTSSAPTGHVRTATCSWAFSSRQKNI